MTPDKVRALFDKLGHRWFDDGRWNLFGIRTGIGVTDLFDDCIGIMREPLREDDAEFFHYWPGTTDAGKMNVDNPVNAKGCAVLVPGQYSAWQFGLHNGKYEALVQTGGMVRVYRDNNKDGVYNNDVEIEEGWFGINIHRAAPGMVTEMVGPYSAGCQVFKSAGDFDKFMAYLKSDAANFGVKTFAYTLFNLEQFQLV